MVVVRTICCEKEGEGFFRDRAAEEPSPLSGEERSGQLTDRPLARLCALMCHPSLLLEPSNEASGLGRCSCPIEPLKCDKYPSPPLPNEGLLRGALLLVFGASPASLARLLFPTLNTFPVCRGDPEL